MSKIYFKFVFGSYSLEPKSDLEAENLKKIMQMQMDLLDILPHRAEHINNFIISCVNDYHTFVSTSSKKD